MWFLHVPLAKCLLGVGVGVDVGFCVEGRVVLCLFFFFSFLSSFSFFVCIARIFFKVGRDCQIPVLFSFFFHCFCHLLNRQTDMHIHTHALC